MEQGPPSILESYLKCVNESFGLLDKVMEMRIKESNQDPWKQDPIDELVDGMTNDLILGVMKEVGACREEAVELIRRFLK